MIATILGLGPLGRHALIAVAVVGALAWFGADQRAKGRQAEIARQLQAEQAENARRQEVIRRTQLEAEHQAAEHQAGKAKNEELLRAIETASKGSDGSACLGPGTVERLSQLR